MLAARLPIELRGIRGAAAPIRQRDDLDDDDESRLANRNGLARMQRAGGLDALVADPRLSGVDRLRGQAAGLVEAGRPQPLVEAERVERRAPVARQRAWSSAAEGMAYRSIHSAVAVASA